MNRVGYSINSAFQNHLLISISTCDAANLNRLSIELINNHYNNVIE